MFSNPRSRNDVIRNFLVLSPPILSFLLSFLYFTHLKEKYNPTFFFLDPSSPVVVLALVFRGTRSRPWLKEKCKMKILILLHITQCLEIIAVTIWASHSCKRFQKPWAILNLKFRVTTLSHYVQQSELCRHTLQNTYVFCITYINVLYFIILYLCFLDGDNLLVGEPALEAGGPGDLELPSVLLKGKHFHSRIE